MFGVALGITIDDFKRLLSGLVVTLEPGTYDVAVGGYSLEYYDAEGTINYESDGEFGEYNLVIGAGAAGYGLINRNFSSF